MLPETDRLPVIWAEPVTNKAPVINNISAFEENTFTPSAPLIEKLPVTPKLPVICVDPEIFVFVLTTKPLLGEIEADTEPELI